MLHHHFDLDVHTFQFSTSFDIIEMIVNNLLFRDAEQFDDINDGQDDQDE
jgi:hypothetical protein